MAVSKTIEPKASAAVPAPGFRPLYQQVREVLVQRISDQIWAPGAMLPSEQQIAAELGVSQGTVRKALDEMTADRLLVRRQGRGTFVASHDEAQILFHYFRIVPDDGARAYPESSFRDVAIRVADATERKMLILSAGDKVIRMSRLRSIGGRAIISEYIVLPAALFPGLGNTIPVQNNLYALFSTRFGITVSGGRERVRAVAAATEDAQLLGIAPDSPILSIDRIAMSLEGTPVEWRRSFCLTDEAAYQVDLA
jgi:GntR family transcriptional regulator